MLVPTWRGWLCILLVFGGLGVVALTTIHPFLAVSAPESGGILVVEGWLPDRALEQAIARFRQGGYDMVYVTGGPLDLGGPLAGFKTYADVSTAIMQKMGLEPKFLQPVPAPRVKQDRTYTSALALRRWFEVHNLHPQRLTVVTEGAHARRSWLLFEKVFGKEARVGIVAIEPQDYEPKSWWTSSQGVRIVGSELLAYGYARFLFWPRTPGNSMAPADVNERPPEAKPALPATEPAR